METPERPDDLERILTELDALVNEAARLEQALDQARAVELAPRPLPDRRRGERRELTERRHGDRRQR